MSILDFEDQIKVISGSGKTITAQFKGDAEILSFLSSNLGHAETAIAYQKWIRAVLITDTEIPRPKNCTLIFTDGSKRSVVIKKHNFNGVQFVYDIDFG